MPVSYNNDILPLFTQTDIDHMQPMNVFLSTYSWMSDPTGDHQNANAVFGQVSSGQMPPGNPWSSDNVQLFQSWMNDGYQP